MRVRFHGAAGEVTGSCHEVEFADGRRLLLDCGMIQGSARDELRNREPFPFDVPSLAGVVLSHAHIDHCGRLPVLVARGFRGPIWTQAATADLLRIMLEDAASLAERDAELDNRHRRDDRADHEPLFTRADVARTLKLVRPLPYDAATEVLPGVRLVLRDAGHILGSASVELAAVVDGRERVLVFSGDVGMKGTPILRDPAPVPRADLVLMESTYGDRLHRDRAATIDEIGAVLDDAFASGGNVLVPAFAVGRSQELLYQFARHWDAWKLARWKIFLDSPMAARVAEVYDRHDALFDPQGRAAWAGRPHPFRLPNLRMTVDAAQSKAINGVRGGAIVIAGSGMCNGGRIRHHLLHNLALPQAHVLFVGYQGHGTLGRRLVDGARDVRLLGEQVPVRARMHTIGGLSAHADQAGLVDWATRIDGAPPVVLVHGEDPARTALAAKLAERGLRATLARPGLEIAV
jgi:metallo-beta-lactamase family protein